MGVCLSVVVLDVVREWVVVDSEEPFHEMRRKTWYVHWTGHVETRPVATCMSLPIADHHRKYHPSPFTPFQEGVGGLEIMSDPRVFRPP